MKVSQLLSNNKTLYIFLAFILALGLFLRFYNLGEWMHFANDEGRDAFIVQDIIQGQKFPLLGPPAPSGRPDFHLGPAFYYLLAPFFWLFNLSPLGGTFLIALLSFFSIFLIYQFGQEVFSRQVGLIAASLFAFSYLVVKYSRWSWNPNPLSFFVLLIFYSLFKLTRGRENYLIPLAISLGLAIQLHATALFILPPLLIIYWLIFRPPVKKKYKYLLALLCFFIVISPLIVHEIKYAGGNTQGLIRVLTQKGTENLGWEEKINNTFFAFRNFWPDALSAGHFPMVSFLLVVGSLALLFTQIYLVVKERKKDFGVILLFLWLVFPFGLFIFFKETIYTHYFSFLYPLPFLLVAWLLNFLWSKKGLKSLVFIFLIFLVLINFYVLSLYFTGLKSAGHRAAAHPVTLAEMKKVVNYIKEEAKNEKFTFESRPALLYDQAYLYLLQREGLEPSIVPEKTSFLIINPPVILSEEEMKNKNIEQIKELDVLKVIKILN